MANTAVVSAGPRIDEALALADTTGSEVVANYGAALLVRFDGDDPGFAAAGFPVRAVEDHDVLRVRGVEVTTSEVPDLSSVGGGAFAASPGGRGHYVIALAGPMHPDWQTGFDDLGVTVVERLGGETFLIGVDEANVANVRALPYVDSVTPYVAALKINQALLDTEVQAGLDSVAGMAITGAAPSTSDRSDGRDGDVTRADGVVELGTHWTVNRPAPEPPRQVEVLLFDEADSAAAEASLNAMNASFSLTGANKIVVEADPAQVAAIAAIAEVREVNPHRENRLHNNVATGLIDADVLHTDHGLDGSGQIVAVGDSGLDTGVDDATMLADFQGRIVSLIGLGRPGDPSDFNGHGTHVAGSVLGDGANSNGRIRGTAPAAELVFQSIMSANGSLGGIPADLANGYFDVARDLGARIHTNSWGADNDGLYSANSGEADTFAFNNREFLILFSAGNDAPNRIGDPGTAKNVLTVGASESVRPLPATVNLPDSPTFPNGAVFTSGIQADDATDIAAFSSLGPTQNNRIKPDVVAPGSWILSTRSSVAIADTGDDGIPGTGDEDGTETHPEAVGLGLPGQPIFRVGDANAPAAPAGSGPLASDNYMYQNGTSMATPLTAGTCALVRQYLIEQRDHVPSAALIKALLVNSAVDLGGGIPANDQGWGRIDLDEALFPTVTGRVQFDDTLDSAVTTGETRTYDVHVSSTAEPLSVTLVWRDPPGAALQNQLHLRVRPAGGAAVSSEPIGNIQNNVQRVVIDTPVVGTYQIEVEGVSIATGVPELAGLQQDFALVVANATGFSCNPSDIVQVIDRSASMGFFGYMEPAKERAKQMVDILQINDRTGVVSFNSSSTPGVPSPLTDLISQNDKDLIKGQITSISPGGNTDLREALDDGVTTLGAAGGRPQAIVFLSDGHHTVTTPEIDDPFLAGIAAAGIRVYTISLGSASDLAVLNDIAAQTGTGAAYQVASAADLHKLHEIYYDILGGIDCGGVVHLQSGGANVGGVTDRSLHLDNFVSEALFSASWDDVNAEVELELVDPNNNVISQNTTGVSYRQGSSYAFFRVTQPRGGAWKIRARTHSGGPVSLTSAVIAESDVRCRLEVTPIDRRNRFVVRAMAEFDGKPLRRAKAQLIGRFATRSIAQIIKEERRALEAIDLNDDEVKKAGDDPLLARVNILAAQLAKEGRDLFEHKAVEMRLVEGGTPGSGSDKEGLYEVEVDLNDLAPAGNLELRVSFAASTTKIGRHECTKLLTVAVPERKGGTGDSGGTGDLKIGDLIVRRNKLWRHTIIGVPLRAGSKVVTPDDKAEVSIVATVRGRRIESDPLPFYSRGQYFIWRVDKDLIKPDEKVTCEVLVSLGGKVVAESKHTITF